jgi:hypothetical protein
LAAGAGKWHLRRHGQERNFEMRDELDARIWVANHDGFSAGIDDAFAALRAGLARVAQWDGTTHQLLAMVAAFVITGLTFNATTAA